MKVLVGWSGERSWQLAIFLRNWLKDVVQALDPWVSGKDIDKGVGWDAEVAAALQESRVGIICLTPENLQEPWLHFEAGALSKQRFDTEKNHVCTYLLGLSPTEIPNGPLAQFQHTKAEREDTRALLHTINSLLGDSALSEKQLDTAFDRWWPDLEEKLQELQSMRVEPPPKRTQQAMLEELLESVRGLVRRLEALQSRELFTALRQVFQDVGRAAALENEALRAGFGTGAVDLARSLGFEALTGRRRSGSVPPVAAPPPPPGSAPMVPLPSPDEEAKDG